MIDLHGLTPFASGGNRHCYIHPEDAGKCVKVARQEVIDKRFKGSSWIKRLQGRDRLDDNLQELKGYRQLRKVAASPQLYDHIPQLWGRELTSEGMANVSELITTATGEVAPNLSQWLVQQGMDEATTVAIREFQSWLRAHQVLTRNLLPHNLAVKSGPQGIRLYIIDGLGAPDFLALLYPLRSWRQQYIERKIRNMNLRIQWELDGRPGQWRTAQKAIIARSKHSK
ncbi:MAG: hypothetical protein GYB41_03695 [Oceanospirillales bacterium]|nr:hypothetical protein [Oceanospirillales bacterium]